MIYTYSLRVLYRTMSSLKKLKLDELRAKGEAKGIDVTGLTRLQIIEQLTHIDESSAEGDAVEQADDDGNEVNFSTDTLTPEIRALTLQLELEK